MIIVDFKFVDIFNMNRLIVSKVFEVGVDYIIVYGFVGRDSVEVVMEFGKMIIVVEMSYFGVKEFI